MKNLFEPSSVREIKMRLDQLTPQSPRQWGSMNASQAVAHCAMGFEMAMGDRRLPRVLIGRLIGPAIKARVMADDKPIRRNSPTAKDLIVDNERDLCAERQRLNSLVDRFSNGGPGGCTTHPHPFFGAMTPDEWSILMYKHLDHHLRQFGA